MFLGSFDDMKMHSDIGWLNHKRIKFIYLQKDFLLFDQVDDLFSRCVDVVDDVQ